MLPLLNSHGYYFTKRDFPTDIHIIYELQLGQLAMNTFLLLVKDNLSLVVIGSIGLEVQVHVYVADNPTLRNLAAKVIYFCHF